MPWKKNPCTKPPTYFSGESHREKEAAKSRIKGWTRVISNTVKIGTVVLAGQNVLKRRRKMNALG